MNKKLDIMLPQQKYKTYNKQEHEVKNNDNFTNLKFKKILV